MKLASETPVEAIASAAPCIVVRGCVEALIGQDELELRNGSRGDADVRRHDRANTLFCCEHVVAISDSRVHGVRARRCRELRTVLRQIDANTHRQADTQRMPCKLLRVQLDTYG